MISIIITSYKEPKTIGKAIDAIGKQKHNFKTEIIVVAPDKETLDAAKKYKSKYKQLRVIQDKGNGKPAALNLVIPKTKGDILILTDGDIYISNNSIYELVKPFENKKVGAVTGYPVSIDKKNNMFGYWAYILTNMAHYFRLKLKNRPFFCTGYLFSIRKNLFPKLPENLLSEDGFISYNVYKNNKIIKYAPNAKAYIKYPTNFKDWIIQKKRSTGGYNQIKEMIDFNVRSFSKELQGFYLPFKFVKNIKELYWLICLYFARLYLWVVIYIDINIKKKKQKDIWKRVESTK